MSKKYATWTTRVFTGSVVVASLVWFASGVVAQEKERLKLSEGVIHVQLPPGEVRMENIARFGKTLIQLSVGKTVIEAKTMFLGDPKGATRFESTKEGIHWTPASGGKGFTFGNGSASVREPATTIGDPDFYTLDKLKPGSVFVTTPSIRFVFGQAAKPRPMGREGPENAKPKAQDGPNLPDGVTHVAFPAGQVRMANTTRDDKPIFRISVDKTVVETRVFFFGDAKSAGEWDAAEAGTGNVYLHNPASTMGHLNFLPVDKLKSGSLHVTTLSVKFLWGKDAIPDR
jgi:hypothetical protein